jgi:hypothetical protein
VWGGGKVPSGDDGSRRTVADPLSGLEDVDESFADAARLLTLASDDAIKKGVSCLLPCARRMATIAHADRDVSRRAVEAGASAWTLMRLPLHLGSRLTGRTTGWTTFLSGWQPNSFNRSSAMTTLDVLLHSACPFLSAQLVQLPFGRAPLGLVLSRRPVLGGVHAAATRNHGPPR